MPLLPNEIVAKIVKDLPVKELMRLKTLSSNWRSSISSEDVALAYRGQQKGLLLSSNVISFSHKTNLFFVALNSEDKGSPFDIEIGFPFDIEIEEESGSEDQNEEANDEGEHPTLVLTHYVTIEHDLPVKFTSPVNGMMCFYTGQHSYLYNIATREKLLLPESYSNHPSVTYHLGFHPSLNLYKVVKTQPVYDDKFKFLYNGESEIFTIGIDHFWRRIPGCPWELAQTTNYRALCIKGTLYWIQASQVNNIISFNLESEGFELTVNRIGHLELPWFSPSLVAFKYGDNDDMEFAVQGILSCYLETNERHYFLSPTGFCHGDRYRAVGILPNNKIVIFDSGHDTKMPVPLLLYDTTQLEMECFIIRKNMQSPLHWRILEEEGIHGFLDYFEENLMPLKCLGKQVYACES